MNFNLISKCLVMEYLLLRDFFAKKIYRRPEVRGQIVLQIYFSGYDASNLVLLLGAVIGLILASENLFSLDPAAHNKMADSILQLCFKSLGPIFVSTLMISRSITAVTSHVATQAVNQELFLLKTLGINVEQFVILPIFIGASLSGLCLGLYLFCGAIMSSAALLFLQKGSPLAYIWYLISRIGYLDITFFFTKLFVLNGIIFLMATYYAMEAKFPFEVPQVTTKAVVSAQVLIFVVHAFLILSQMFLDGSLDGFFKFI